MEGGGEKKVECLKIELEKSTVTCRRRWRSGNWCKLWSKSHSALWLQQLWLSCFMCASLHLPQCMKKWEIALVLPKSISSKPKLQLLIWPACACVRVWVCVRWGGWRGSEEEAVWRVERSSNKHLSFINKTRLSWRRLLRAAEEKRLLVLLGRSVFGEGGQPWFWCGPPRQTRRRAALQSIIDGAHCR